MLRPSNRRLAIENHPLNSFIEQLGPIKKNVCFLFATAIFDIKVHHIWDIKSSGKPKKMISVYTAGSQNVPQVLFVRWYITTSNYHMDSYELQNMNRCNSFPMVFGAHSCHLTHKITIGRTGPGLAGGFKVSLDLPWAWEWEWGSVDEWGTFHEN